MTPSRRGAGTRAEWERMRAQGLRRFLAIGALRRGLPMAVAVLVVIELLDGHDFGAERLGSLDFLGRLATVVAVFLLGGLVSAYARWKSFEALYGEESTSGGSLR